MHMKTISRTESILTSPVFWVSIISFITFVAYYPSLLGNLTNWDDMVYIRDNPYIKVISFDNLKAIFSNNYMGNYHPLAMLSLAIDYQFYQINPFGFHLTNLILHISNTLIVLYVIRALTGNLMIGVFTGLIFGVHTFHVESVAWISERKDVLYAFFYLLSLLVYIKFIKKGDFKLYLISLLLFLLACLSKGQAVTFGFSIILVDIFIGRKWTSLKIILEKVPFFLIAFIFGIIAIKAQEGADATIMANFPIHQRFAFASYGLVMYIVKLVLPLSLSSYYPYPIVSDFGEVPLMYWLCIIPAFILLCVWVLSFKKSKPLFFGIGFFLLNIVLLLQLLPVGRAIMADRYVYIPSIGYCFLIGWYLNDRKLLKSGNSAFIVLFIYVFILGFLTFQRGKVWRSSMTLWSDVLDKNTQVPIAWYNRGNIHMDSGNYQAAMSDYNECLNVDSNYWRAYINRGTVKNELKNYIGAITDFSKVINEKSSSFTAYVNRAHSYRMLEDYENSLKDYNQALSLKPTQIELYTSRSNLKAEMRDFQGAISDLTEAIQLNPNYVAGYSNRAIIRKRVNDYQGAIEDYNRAVEIDPRSSEYLNNRGNLKFQTGDIDGALTDYSKSIQINPDQYLGYKNRGTLYFSLNNVDKALADYLVAMRLNPTSGELCYNLALVKKKKQDHAGALADYTKAIELDPIYATDEFRVKLGIKSSEISQFQPSQFVVRGKAMESGGNLREAENLYKKAIEINPAYAEAWYNLGNIYGKTGKFNEAMNCLNKAISFKGNYAEALSSRGIAYASMGKINEALKDLSTSIQADPKYAAAYFNRAVVYLNSGKKEFACSDLKKAIELGYTAAYSIFQKECQQK